MEKRPSRKTAWLLVASTALVLMGADRCGNRGRKAKPLGFVNDGRVENMTVHLADGEEVSVEAYGDLMLDLDLNVIALNYTLSSVPIGDDLETGLITLSLDPSKPAFSKGDLDGGTLQVNFAATIQYQLIADRAGYVSSDGHAQLIPSELAAASLRTEAIGEPPFTACLHLEIEHSITGYLSSFELCGIPIGFNEGNKPRCPAKKKCKETKLCLQPIVIADANGANPTTCPSFNKTKSIWKKCCKDIQVNSTKTVNKPRFKKLTILRNNAVSAEQALLMREATDNANAAPNNACVEVYCVLRFVDGTGTEGEDILGGALSNASGTASARIIVQSDTDATNVAHEVGHAVGLSHPTDGAGKAKDDGTVMHPSGKNKTAVKEKQSRSNCNNGKKGNCKLKQPKKDCCKTWELDQ